MLDAPTYKRDKMEASYILLERSTKLSNDIDKIQKYIDSEKYKYTNEMAYKYAFRKEIAEINKLKELRDLSYNLYLSKRGLQ